MRKLLTERVAAIVVMASEKKCTLVAGFYIPVLLLTTLKYW